jgi:hypothetical protein
MKELYLADKRHLEDSEGIRYSRTKPVLRLECKMTSRGRHIRPEYFEQQILDLQKAGQLKKGLFAVNAFAVLKRRNVDQKETLKRSWGPTEYRIREIADIELYDLSK